MRPELDRLKPYVFERLARLRARAGADLRTDLPEIKFSIGEPQLAPPAFVLDALSVHRDAYGSYPASKGMPELRAACARWLERRFGLGRDAVDPETEVLPVAGTREALFSFIFAVADRDRPGAAVAMPNPFYPVYEGATELAGLDPVFLNCTAETAYLPDLEAVPAETWDRVQLLFLCSPDNPTGAVAPVELYERAIELADRHDFVLASDECYSEIYRADADPPTGLLEVCRRLGRDDFRRCVVFHSLSKRSSLPGLRSGFVAGDAEILGPYLRYRSYHGATIPEPTQHASIAAWSDETHVEEVRHAYDERIDAVLEALGPAVDCRRPEGAFYLWLETPVDDDEFTLALYRDWHVHVLPGSYLGAETDSGNPGAGHVRLSLVHDVATCVEGARRIVACLDAV